MTRTVEGRFAPGHSGNPNGRPKTPAHIKAMLEGLTEKAVLALGEALDGDDPKLKLAAAQEVLNRALGKPHTSASIDLTQNNTPAAHLAALTQLAVAQRALTGAVPITIEADAYPQRSSHGLLTGDEAEPVPAPPTRLLVVREDE